MIYKHLGQRRQVAGLESDAGCIRSSGKVEHRIENVTLAQPRSDATPRDAVCTFGHRREQKQSRGCFHLDNPKAFPLTSWQMPLLAWIPLNQKMSSKFTKSLTSPADFAISSKHHMSCT